MSAKTRHEEAKRHAPTIASMFNLGPFLNIWQEAWILMQARGNISCHKNCENPPQKGERARNQKPV
eukprot:11167594-Lingulodinium_polyedra.AAC.1